VICLSSLLIVIVFNLKPTSWIWTEIVSGVRVSRVSIAAASPEMGAPAAAFHVASPDGLQQRVIEEGSFKTIFENVADGKPRS